MRAGPKKEASLLLLLAMLSAIAPAALHMPVPSLPLLAKVFDASASETELVLTLFLAGIAVGQLIYGPFSDRFGRRPVLLWGLLVYLAGSAACALAPSLLLLIAGRVFAALGGCAGLVVGRAIIRDLYESERATRAIAVVTMAMTLAPSAAPAVGAYLALWVGWRADFLFLLAIGAAAFVLTATRLAETNIDPEPLDLRESAASFLVLLRSPLFLGFSFASAFTSASWYSFTASAPYLLTGVLHEPLSAYGLLIILPMGGFILGNALAARSAFYFGSSALFLCGLLLSVVAGAMLALWSFAGGLSTWSMFVPMTLSALGNGLSQPAAIVAGLSLYPRLAGAASGAIGFLQMAISAFGTLLIGALPQEAVFFMILLVTLFMLLAALCGIYALRAGFASTFSLTPAAQSSFAGEPFLSSSRAREEG